MTHRRRTQFPAGEPVPVPPPSASGAAGGWSGRDVLCAAAFVTYLALQIAIPLRSVGSDRLERFSWQMYSIPGDAAAYVVEMASGTADTIPLHRYVVHPRLEIDWSRRYPAHLCEVVAGAAVVHKTSSRVSPEVVYPCR